MHERVTEGKCSTLVSWSLSEIELGQSVMMSPKQSIDDGGLRSGVLWGEWVLGLQVSEWVEQQLIVF